VIFRWVAHDPLFQERLFAAGVAGMLLIVGISGSFGLLVLIAYVYYLAPRPYKRLK
jgi:hypothetical protein